MPRWTKLGNSPHGFSKFKVRGRVRLLVEMEAAFVGTVDITTDMPLQDVRVEVHLSNDGEHDPGGS